MISYSIILIDTCHAYLIFSKINKQKNHILLFENDLAPINQTTVSNSNANLTASQFLQNKNNTGLDDTYMDSG